MIPTVNSALIGLSVETQPSAQHQMVLDRNRIIGICDGLDAVKQTIFKILNTERYGYEIYSWNYGIELMDLYGQPISLACPEIERRVTEALMQDDRITDVDEFDFSLGKNSITASFTVHTIYGDVKEERVVNI